MMTTFCISQPIWSDQEGSDTNTESSNNADDEGSDSQWDDPEWRKHPFSAPSVKSDGVNVVPPKAFIDTNGPLKFFKKFISDDVIQLLVEQTNLYAKQRKKGTGMM